MLFEKWCWQTHTTPGSHKPSICKQRSICKAQSSKHSPTEVCLYFMVLDSTFFWWWREMMKCLREMKRGEGSRPRDVARLLLTFRRDAWPEVRLNVRSRSICSQRGADLGELKPQIRGSTSSTSRDLFLFYSQWNIKFPSRHSLVFSGFHLYSLLLLTIWRYYQTQVVFEKVFGFKEQRPQKKEGD